MYNASAGWRPTKAAAVSHCRIGAPQRELRDVKAIIGLCKPLVYTKPGLNTNEPKDGVTFCLLSNIKSIQKPNS